MAMQDGAYDGNVLQNYWKVLQTKVNDFFLNRSSRTINTPALFPYLLTQANQTAGQFDLDQIKMDWQASLSSGKKGLVASVRWMPPLQMDDVDDGNGLPCDFSDSVEAEYKNFAYEIKKKKTSKKIKVDNAVVRCIREGRDEYNADALGNLVRATVSSLARDVEGTIYDVANGYIGDFPDRFSGTVDTSPGKPLNLFRDQANAYNTINPIEESEMRMDIRQAGIPEWVIFGGTRAQHYADLKNISGPNFNTGYDPSMLETFETSRFFFDDYIQDGVKNTGRPAAPQNPMLVYRPGALQFISTARNQNADYQLNTDQYVRTTIVDPIFGLTWDLYITLEPCGSDLAWYAYLELHWAVIGYPSDSCWQDDPKRQGVTDLLLYDVQCGDNPICNLPVDKQPATINSQYVNDNCDLDETCDPGCSVTLDDSFLANGDYKIVAFPCPSLGAAALVSGDYAWEVNGSPVATPANPNVLELTAGAYSDGDTIELTITDSTGCVAVANLVVTIPEVAVEVVDNTSAPLVDGGTATIATATQAAATAVVNNITNVGGLDPLTITNIVVAGDVAAGYIAPSGFPKSAPFSFNFDWDVSTTGLKTVTVSVFTNDPNTAEFDYSVTITLT
jgi:hypothetical protein